MRYLLCGLGWMFALAALGAGAWEVVAPGPGGALRPLGEAWFRLDAGSLNLTQAIVERYLLPQLWDPVIVALLQRPAVVVLAVPAAILLVWCLALGLWRRRARRG